MQCFELRLKLVIKCFKQLERKNMAIKIPAIDEESLLIFQKEVQEQYNLLISDVFAQSLINRIRELELALDSATKT
jgi:hypothetical protein